jgi:hypothetical protein
MQPSPASPASQPAKRRVARAIFETEDELHLPQSSGILNTFVGQLEAELENIPDEFVTFAFEEPEEPKQQISSLSSLPQQLISNEGQFWEYLETLDWQDRSVKIIIPALMRAKLRVELNDADLQKFRKYLDQYADALAPKISFLDGKNKTDLLSHIVARGSVYYNILYEDPDFAVGLLGEPGGQSEYQSLYDCLP